MHYRIAIVALALWTGGQAGATTIVFVTGAAGYSNPITGHGFVDTFGPNGDPVVTGQRSIERELSLAGTFEGFDYVAHAYASADLYSGQLKYRQENAGLGLGGAGARFIDSLTFQGPFNAGDHYAIPFSLTVQGTVTAGISTAFFRAEGELGGPNLTQRLSTGTIVLSGVAHGFQVFGIDVAIVSGPTIQGGIFGPGLQDFSSTASLSLDLPPGVTFTSESGVFLTAIPEPSSLVLFGTGLAGLMVHAWRRVRQTIEF